MLLTIRRQSTNKFKEESLLIPPSVQFFASPVRPSHTVYQSQPSSLVTSTPSYALPQYPHSLVPENRLIERVCCVRKYNLPKKEIAISLINFTLPYCASSDVITMLSRATYCDCKNTQIVLSLRRVNGFLSDARKGKLLG